MYTSRFLSAAIVIGVGVGTTIIACSSSNNTHTDAKVFKDSKVFLDGPGGATGIGKDCTGSGGNPNTAACPSSDPVCTSLNTAFFCTESCGTSACAPGGTAGSADCLMSGSGAQPTPPTGGA